MSKRLLEIGIDVTTVIKRLGGNELCYLSICCKFIDDLNYPKLQKALEKNDFQEAKLRLHTLKGVAANLGFTLFEMLCVSMMEKIRNAEYSLLENDNIKLSEEYHRIISVLKK